MIFGAAICALAIAPFSASATELFRPEFKFETSRTEREQSSSAHAPALDYAPSQSGTRKLPKYLGSRGELYLLGSRGVIETSDHISLAVRSDARVTLKLRMTW